MGIVISIGERGSISVYFGYLINVGDVACFYGFFFKLKLTEVDFISYVEDRFAIIGNMVS